MRLILICIFVCGFISQSAFADCYSKEHHHRMYKKSKDEPIEVCIQLKSCDSLYENSQTDSESGITLTSLSEKVKETWIACGLKNGKCPSLRSCENDTTVDREDVEDLVDGEKPNRSESKASSTKETRGEQ